MRKVTILKQFLLADVPRDVVELVDLIVGGLAQLLLHLLEHPLLFLQLLLVDILTLLVLLLTGGVALPLVLLEQLVQVDVVDRAQAFDLLREELVLGREVQGVVDGVDEDAELNKLFFYLLDLIDEGDHLGLFLGEDVELYEDDPEVKELVLLLPVFNALGV